MARKVVTVKANNNNNNNKSSKVSKKEVKQQHQQQQQQQQQQNDSEITESTPPTPVKDRVIYARKAGEAASSAQVHEGEKLDLETASKLKELLWGSSNMPPKPEWMKQGLIFHPSEQVFAYGLQVPQNGTKNFLMCFQAYLLKQLLFDKKGKGASSRKTHILDQEASSQAATSGKQAATGRKKDQLKTLSEMLKPTDKIQQEMLIGALAEVLLKLAEGDEAVFCLPGPENCFEPTAYYAIDGITEKLRLFKSRKEEELKGFIKKYVATLQEKNGIGLLCLLYSCILSRRPSRVTSDLQDQVSLALVDPMGEGTAPLLNLLVTGRATPYLHNGILESEEGTELVGLIGRNDIGLLLWEGDEAGTAEVNLGSRLKTPVMPIWVTRCNGKVGVLFNPNRELMRSYHAENRFQLFYYSDPTEAKKPAEGASPTTSTKQDTILTIDTRSLRSNGTSASFVDPTETEFDETPAPALEKAIQTKWEGCEIDWNGVTPFV